MSSPLRPSVRLPTLSSCNAEERAGPEHQQPSRMHRSTDKRAHVSVEEDMLASASHTSTTEESELAQLKSLLKFQTRRLRSHQATTRETDSMNSVSAQPLAPPPLCGELTTFSGEGNLSAPVVGDEPTSGSTSLASGRLLVIPGVTSSRLPRSLTPLVHCARNNNDSHVSRARSENQICKAERHLSLRSAAVYNPQFIVKAVGPLSENGTALLHVASPTTAGDDVDGEQGDPELFQLARDITERENRMAKRADELRRLLKKPAREGTSRASISPSTPLALKAKLDSEVCARAALANEFAHACSSRKKAAVLSAQADSDDDINLSETVFVYGENGVEGASMDRNNTSEPKALGPREFGERSMASLTMGCLSMCSSSACHCTDSVMAVLELLEKRPDLFLPSPSETVTHRCGDVLSSHHILKVDLQDVLHSRNGLTGMISGAPYFRIVPKMNVAGVAQANASAIKTIINELRRANIDGDIVWVNLREEPLVYINNAAHIVRERQDPFKPVIIPNVTGRSIEAVEMKLKQEVQQEAYENGGNISVQSEGKGGVLEDQWECADPSAVTTLAEIFHHIIRSTKHGHHLRYYRRPITQNIGPQPVDFDFIYSICIEDPKAMLVFNCQTGRGRTSAMMQIATIVRFYQWCEKDVTVDVRVLRGDIHTLTFRTIQKLVSLIPDGKLHERRLVILMELADKVYSMSEHIRKAFTGDDIDPKEAAMRLQLYAYFLVFSYYCEQRLWGYSTKLPFSEWLQINPEMKVLIDNIRENVDLQLKQERIIAPVDNGSEAGISRIVRHRRGNVLSAGRILCSLPMNEDLRSVKALRQLAPDVPIFTCGRMGPEARQDLVREIRAAFPQQQKLQWLSLRAEPMVFINGISYTLTDYSAPPTMAENGTTMHVSLHAIEQIEDRLRRDVLLEAQEHDGEIVLHRIDETGNRMAVRVKVLTVRTPKSTMESFADSADVTYHRVPIPFSGQMLLTDIDPFLKYLSETYSQEDILVINDTEGSSRTTVALNILTLYRASRVMDLRAIHNINDMLNILRVGNTCNLLPSAQLAMTLTADSSTVPDHDIEPHIASVICQMLTAGTLLRTVDTAIELGGRGNNWNILHTLAYLKRQIPQTGGNKRQAVLNAINCLRSYLIVLLSALYLDDRGDYVNELPLSAWVLEHTEVNNIILGLESRGEASLKFIAHNTVIMADVARRHGEVLTANFCMKADHFPGCQRKGLRPEVCGAPSFRKVELVNVYGVGIPTLLGIHNVLALLGASDEAMLTYHGQVNDSELYRGFAAPRLFDPSFKPEALRKPLRGSVVWVNMREEPILYIGDRPFVFRDLGAPYVNVELTGIETKKVEHIETQLRTDVLTEGKEYGGRFLVHDEASPGELVGMWEPATEATVKTLREVYSEMEAKGFRCQMIRLPVTDEQSPAEGDFDVLVQILLPRIAEHLDRRETLSFVFNCQMGRGRTTTGMVVCCLLIGLVIPEYYDELRSQYTPLYTADQTHLGRGEYTVITQLRRVLTLGRLAKEKVDLVLEACSTLQNLRTAIEGFALSLMSPDTPEESRARAHHAGVHYLRRYFNLIAFAGYLDEEYDAMKKGMRTTFVQWMAMRPELTTLLSTAALK